MDEYVCIVVCSLEGESGADFSARLSKFWTGMLRDCKDDFEKVYAETSEFDEEGGKLTRTYLAEADVVDLLEERLRAAAIHFKPIDRDDLYSKYEAVSPEWMQIEH